MTCRKMFVPLLYCSRWHTLRSSIGAKSARRLNRICAGKGDDDDEEAGACCAETARLPCM